MALRIKNKSGRFRLYYIGVGLLTNSLPLVPITFYKDNHQNPVPIVKIPILGFRIEGLHGLGFTWVRVL